MLGSLEILCDDPSLRSLLNIYRDRHEAKVDPEGWHDRVLTHGPGESAAVLSKRYGSLIANGWIATRVSHESLTAEGRIVRAYQITRAGLAALRNTEDRFGNVTFSSPHPDDVMIDLGDS